MVEFRVGDTIILCASVRDFCTEIYSLYFIGDINISKSPTQCPITVWTPRCLDFSGILFEFQWVNENDPTTAVHTCSDTVKLKTLGSAYTDSQGKAAITYTLTSEDLNLYNTNIEFDLRVCIKNKTPPEVLSGYVGKVRNEFHPGDYIVIRQNLCIGVTCPSDDCTGLDLYEYICNPETGNCDRILKELNSPVCKATHRLELRMAFVPTELMDLFDKYISDISNKLMTYISSPPLPWVYLGTIYDRTTNAFNILLYTPSTLGIMEDIKNLTDWIAAYWGMILGVIFAILGIVLFLLGMPVAAFLIFLAGASLIFVGWKLYEVKTALVKAKEAATNANVQISQTDKENEGITIINNIWESSEKTYDDCLTRLNSFRDLHIAIIDGYINQYSKYASLVTSLETEKTNYTNTANSIIDEYKTKTYDIGVCDTYYVKLDGERISSNLRISNLLKSLIDPEGEYTPPKCTYVDKDSCEKAGCYWYDNKCHESPPCLLPIGPYCILTKETAKTLAIIGGVLIGGYIVYRVVTKK